MKRNVAIYARVSTEHEAQLSALENQIQYYDELLSHHPDWKLYERYIDEGVTGTSVKKRQSFVKMMEDANKGCFDLIITREVSRFARNTVDTLQETRKLKKNGVEVYFIEDNIWTFNDEDGELKLTIMATLAQNESKKTSQRVKAGQKISFMNGVFYGNGNILGYDKIGKDMVVNEEQADIVRYIFNSYINGKSAYDIKCNLEQMGKKTSLGKTNWNSASIIRILKNPFYCGTIVYRKSYVPDFLEQKHKINNGEVEQYIVEGKHTPIIEKDEFNFVQELISKNNVVKNKKKYGHRSAKNIWSKILICECGSSFNRSIYCKNGNNQTFCYRCYNQKNTGALSTRLKKGLDISNTCKVKIIQEWKFYFIMYYVFKLLWKQKRNIKKCINKIIEENINFKSFNDSINLQILDLEEKLNLNKVKEQKIIDMYLNELLSEVEYKENKKLLKEKSDNILSEIGELKNELIVREKDINSDINNIDFVINSILISDYNSDKMILKFIKKIIVHNDSFDVYINSGDSNNNILLFNIILTNEDLIKYREKTMNNSKIRLLRNIEVNIYL